MNREQGYKLIELVFIANEKFVMHRCRFSFTALDKSVISYLNISTSKEWRLFIAFLKSDYGRIVVLDHIDRFLNAYGSYALIQRIWKIVTKTPVDLVEATIASERYRDPIFYSLSTLFAYQDKFEDLDKLSTAEIHKLAAKVVHLAQKLYRISKKNNRLFQEAIHSLGSENAFDGKPWEVDSDYHLLPLLRKLEELKAHNEQIYKTVSFGNKQLNHLTEITQSISTNEKRLSEQVEKLAHPLPDIFKIGIACNAFIRNPSTPSSI